MPSDDLMAADVRGGDRGAGDERERRVERAAVPRSGARARAGRGAEQPVDADRPQPVSVMHVCGSHEQAIARFGLRATLPRALDVIMGPGCPVCITDVPEVDEGVVLARQGVRIATYGDMLRVPARCVARRRAGGGRARSTSSTASTQAVELARRIDEQLVFFATGFETTAVATAAVILDVLPPNFFVLSAHKYIPPVMEIVAEMPETRVEGFLAAGHAATITGWGVFEPFVERHRVPVVVAGFEPLDILAGLVKLVELIRDGSAAVVNMFPRCVTREGNLARAGTAVARLPSDRRTLARHRARARTATCACATSSRTSTRAAASTSISSRCGTSRRRRSRSECICGDIMAGIKSPTDCRCSAGVRARDAGRRLHGVAAKARAGSGTSTAGIPTSEDAAWR